MKKTTVEMKLKTYLEKTLNCLNQPGQSQNVGYMKLYHLVHISKALAEGDDNIARILSSWMQDNKEKFRNFCPTENDFYKNTREIENNIHRVLDPEICTGTGSGTKLNEHLHFLMQQISCPEAA
jgi:hypothetical protein